MVERKIIGSHKVDSMETAYIIKLKLMSNVTKYTTNEWTMSVEMTPQLSVESRRPKVVHLFDGTIERLVLRRLVETQPALVVAR